VIPFSLEYYLGVAQNEDSQLDELMNDESFDDEVGKGVVQKMKGKKNK